MIKKYCIWFLLLLVSFSGQVIAKNIDTDLFVKANDAYRNHEYAQALSGYEQLSREVANAEIFYNLANAAFKENQLGKAILNYLKAKKLDPRNSDIRKNLKYAESLVEYRVEDKRNWYWKELLKALDCVRLSECVLLLLCVYFVLVSGLILTMLMNRELSFQKLSGNVALVFIILTIPTLIKLAELKMFAEGVVIDDKVDVRYGPSKSEKLAFNLVEGIQLHIDDQSDEWYRISLANGETGWALKQGIEKV